MQIQCLARTLRYWNKLAGVSILAHWGQDQLHIFLHFCLLGMHANDVMFDVMVALS